MFPPAMDFEVPRTFVSPRRWIFRFLELLFPPAMDFQVPRTCVSPRRGFLRFSEPVLSQGQDPKHYHNSGFHSCFGFGKGLGLRPARPPAFAGLPPASGLRQPSLAQKPCARVTSRPITQSKFWKTQRVLSPEHIEKCFRRGESSRPNGIDGGAPGE